MEKILEILSLVKDKSATAFCLACTKARDVALFIKTKLSVFSRFKEDGHDFIDSLFSSLYIRACDRGLSLDFFHRISSPVSKLSSFAKGRVKRDGVSIFSDSSLMIVSKAHGFLKGKTKVLLGLALVIAFGVLIHINSLDKPYVEVFVNGVSVGTVESPKTVELAKNKVESRISDIIGDCYDIPCTISYGFKKADRPSTDADSLCRVFEEYADSATVSAFGLYIDNERVAAVNTRQDINFALETLEAQHLALTGESAHIANRLDVRYGEYATDEIISRTALIKLLSASNTQEKTPAKLLASSKTMTASADSFSLPEQDETQGTVLISYETVSHETVREYVDFSTRYVEDDTLYKGQTRISTYGHRGLANVTYEVTSVDGEESGRTKVSSTPIYEPVTQVVRIGTKALPETMTEENNGGKFMILPLTNYFITDRYGYRVLNGRSGYHYGLDLAAYYGTEIYAAASGEVIYAGYSSSYGYHVKIEHENGIVTLYAHCSKLLVEKGDTVSQGEIIAEVGNTGYSYGAHCHLEVIVDGQKVNPEDYIYTEE